MLTPVGRRSQTETVAGIYQAFLQRRTWPQAALAKDLDVTVGTYRSGGPTPRAACQTAQG
jgi:hypothetical protein